MITQTNTANFVQQKPFSKVVIWGHKLHSHTHSWIHWAFYRAFKHLGYNTYWLDSKDKTEHIDFSNSLFITEWQDDKDMPLRDDCRYIVHNCHNTKKYDALLKKGMCINLRVYWNKYKEEKYEKIDEYVYIDRDSRLLCMPWATDLLPHEIEKNKEKIKRTKKEKMVCWIGTIGGQKFGNINEITPFRNAVRKNGFMFVEKFLNISMEKNMEYVQKSFIAPAIAGTVQLELGYIPCRIFKNISYGAMGVTNSKTVYDFFEQKIVYNPDTEQLFYDAKKRIENLKWEELFELMDLVRDKHTYLNRIEILFEFMHLIKPFDSRSALQN